MDMLTVKEVDNCYVSSSEHVGDTSTPLSSMDVLTVKDVDSSSECSSRQVANTATPVSNIDVLTVKDVDSSSGSNQIAFDSNMKAPNMKDDFSCHTTNNPSMLLCNTDGLNPNVSEATLVPLETDRILTQGLKHVHCEISDQALSETSSLASSTASDMLSVYDDGPRTPPSDPHLLAKSALRNRLSKIQRQRNAHDDPEGPRTCAKSSTALSDKMIGTRLRSQSRSPTGSIREFGHLSRGSSQSGSTSNSRDVSPTRVVTPTRLAKPIGTNQAASNERIKKRPAPS